MKFFISVLVLLLTGCSVVGPQQRGIRLHSGNAVDVLEPGMHIWFPVILGVSKIEVSIQKSEVTTSAASKDMQEVSTEIAINWSIDPKEVLTLYKNVGDDEIVYENLIKPSVSEVLKAAMSTKTAEQILSERLSLKQNIDALLEQRLGKYGINVLDISIVNLSFTKDFAAAIEAKQIAEQQSKQAKYLADKATQDAVANVNKAKGEAESQRLMHQTLTSEILQLRAIEKWDGHFPEYMGGSLPFINLHARANQ